MKEKIAFVTPIYLPAPLYGSDNAVRILAEDFVAKGQDVTVITSDAATPRYWYDPFFGKKIPSNASNNINGVNVIRLKSQQLISSFTFMLSRFAGRLLPTNMRNMVDIICNGPYFMGLGEVLELEEVDVVHCSPFPLNINKQVVDAVSKLEKKPKVILTPFFHTHVSTYHNRELGRLMGHADVIHAVSNAEKLDLESMFPEAKAKVRSIPLYLPTANLHRPSELQNDVLKFKRKHHLVGKEIVLFAGLKGKMKGALNTLAAVQECYKKDNNIVLVAIGHNTTEWNEMLTSIDTTAFLRDFGYVDERLKEVSFASCDVFCMPSKSETFGYVYLEAWHKKKPVIAANVPAMKELILGNNGGLLVRFGSLGDIQSAIERLVDHPVLSKTLGEHGYNALIEKYSMKSVFPQYCKMFMYV